MIGRARRRACGYEKRLEKKRGSEVARKCWEELRERGGKGKMTLSWEEERRRFFRDRGVELEKVKRRRVEEGDWFRGIVKIDSEEQRKKKLGKFRQLQI